MVGPRGWALAWLLVAGAACQSPAVVAAPPAPPIHGLAAPLPDQATPADGPASAVEIMQRFECARCHDGLPVPEVALTAHCVDCHQKALVGGLIEPGESLVVEDNSSHDTDTKLGQHIDNLVAVPKLQRGGRLTVSWIARFLRQPYAVRPNAHAAMPRLPLRDAEIAALAQWLGAPPVRADERDAGPTGDIARGRATFLASNCTVCHSFDDPSLALTGVPRPFVYREGEWPRLWDYDWDDHPTWPLEWRVNAAANTV